VSFAGDGDYIVDEVIYGDTVSDVLQYVDYQPKVLTNALRAQVEAAVRLGKMTLEESSHLMQRYRQALAAYTYLE
jgi:arginine decarboxylase